MRDDEQRILQTCLLAGAVAVVCAAPAAPRRPADMASPAVETASPSVAPDASVAEPASSAPPQPPAEEPPPAPTYLAAGVHEHQVQIDDQTRRWTTVVPERPDGGLPTALVVVLHGVGGRGADMRSTGFEPLAADRRTVMVYPDGLGGAWNDGRPGADPVVPGVDVDDTRFLRLLIQEATARTGANPRRVAVVGFSNGAVMASRVACELADGVAAVALVGGAGAQAFERACRPTRPVAVMLVAGSNDRTVPYSGGRVADWGTRRRGYVAPVDDVFAFWRAHDGCSSTQFPTGPAQVSVARGVDCGAGTSVLRYRVNGGGHEWFRSPAFDTTSAVWDFVIGRLSTVP